MPFLNARCFYCGARTGQRSSIIDRQWKCSNCEAINYLDESGQISDPPDTITSQPFVKYAYPVRKSTSPVSLSTDKSLFCATCLKNQYLVTQTLAEYLPPPYQHDYSAYEASYEQYRKGLEQRYPQVCSQCEPGVRQHIRVVDYAAKTDHLRRMIANTKMGSIYSARTGWGWREVVVVLMGFLCCASVCIQGIWHMLGVAFETSSKWLSRHEAIEVSSQFCLSSVLKPEQAHHECYALFARLTRYALYMACISVFWHRKLFQKLKTPGGRIKYWGEHLRLQLFTLFVRAVAWWYLHDIYYISVTNAAFRAVHIFMLLFLIMSTTASQYIVDIVYTPKTAHFLDTKSSASNKQENLRKLANNNLDFREPDKRPFQIHVPSYERNFPINKLAPPKQQIAPSIASLPQSPTSSVTSTILTETESEQDDGNEMEWTPTKPTYQALQPMRPLNSSRQIEANPERVKIFGRSLNNGCSNNRFSKQPFQSAKNTSLPAMTQGFSITPTNTQKFRKGLFELDENDRAAATQKGRMILSESKLRLPESILDTGLEPLFEKFFAIRDEPPDITNIVDDSIRVDDESPHKSYNKAWFLATVVSFSVGLVGIGLHVYR